MIIQSLDQLFSVAPYELDKQNKEQLFVPLLNKLTCHHINNCFSYNRIMQAINVDQASAFNKVEDFPFLPVRLFKNYKLMSVPDTEVIKILTSSGTTSQDVSKIYLDKATAAYQTKALVMLMQSFLGKQRLPMLIIDHPNVIKDRKSFSARGAGIIGLMNFGRDHTYLLKNETMEVDFDILNEFLIRYQDEKILIFGFTFMIWRYFYQALERKNKYISIPQGILVHSGGWKKLQDQSVNNSTFKDKLRKQVGINSIHNFYGMVEQVGSIYMECDQGYLHAPIFSDIIIRDPYDWSALPLGEEGIIEVISILPHSYPGHVLLTEDLGVIHGEDDCICGRMGKYFSVSGRIPRAEVRGCSDTHASEVLT